MSSSLLTEPPLNPTHPPFHVDRVLKPAVELPKREHKVIAVLPAYNAATTLAATIADFPPGCVDEILLVDDCSRDNTVELARSMGLTVITHDKNTGYGGNQKTCYRYCLDHGADVVVMIHPDYQYDARVIPHAVGMVELGICDVVLGNRVRSRAEALKCGMPWWK
jgi:glycosyltransferase involved in cell wall biosynthesis